MATQEEFIDAVYVGNLTEAKRLLQAGAQIGQDEILHSVAQQGNVAMLSLLLESGGMDFIDQFDSLSFTPLIYAAREGHLPAMRLLLEAGAQVNAVDTQRIGNTALREVVRDGNISVIELLLSSGADPNIPGWMQMTAVDAAKSQWENTKSDKGHQILDLLNRRQTEAEKILSKKKVKKSRNK